ncbi:MAG TPA: GntR family transcriptional regulator [Beijerinckiaceae bacterium]|nr:GntR family transcriptional regulator [Beijerinckiaceae bacterium]
MENTTPPPAGGSGTNEPLGFRPLYRQVRDRLMRRIADGYWPPGQMLPSEAQIAGEFGVSQGTVRKALDEMAAEHILVRRQGRGTFVSEHNEQRVLFQYFKLVPDDGEREFPESVALSCDQDQASAQERAMLDLPAGAGVIRIRRMRSLRGKPCVSEHITLPAVLFTGLAESEIPNNLYALYAARYGVTIARSTEKLKAVGAPPGDADVLRVARGTPVLRVDRLARSIEGSAAEWRIAYCLTDSFHYLSDLR